MRSELVPQFGIRPSDAPFLLLDVGGRDIGEMLGHASKQSIALRDATTFRGLDNHVRIAVGTPEENDRLLEVLHAV